METWTSSILPVIEGTFVDPQSQMCFRCAANDENATCRSRCKSAHLSSYLNRKALYLRQRSSSPPERKAPLSSACDHYLGDGDDDEDDDERLIDLCQRVWSLFGELKMLFEMKFIFFFWEPS